jgi:hypothetical protein
MQRLQESELLENQEQEDDHWPSRDQQVLPILSQAHIAQGNQVISHQHWAFSDLETAVR